MIIAPFNAGYFALVAFMAAFITVVTLLFRGRSERAKKIVLVGICAANMVLYWIYKYGLSVEPGYAELCGNAYFSWFDELPLQLCNINLFLIPYAAMTKKRGIAGFSFFLAPVGAILAMSSPEPAFIGYSLMLPRMFGYYMTHAFIIVTAILLCTLGFYRPSRRDIPRTLLVFVLLSGVIHCINLVLRATVCPWANYFYTFVEDISLLQLLWKLIPVPYLYLMPALVLVAGYMYLLGGVFDHLAKKKETATV